MIDDILQQKPKRHVKDPNIVPILDMLTTVIFFLLMSTSFIEYTKLTLPPASTVSAPPNPGKNVPPLAPKALLTKRGEAYRIVLSWGGEQPGQSEAGAADEATILGGMKRLAQGFAERYPNEKTLQVSLGRDVRYQSLISMMDGAKDFLPDIVLVSYHTAESESTAAGGVAGKRK